jgi:hypothetical protein
MMYKYVCVVCVYILGMYKYICMYVCVYIYLCTCHIKPPSIVNKAA